jgi:FdrA protein
MTIGKPLLGTELRVVNMGLGLFAEALEKLGVPVVHLDWRPPAGGDMRLAGLLERLKGGGTPAGSGGGSGD